MTERPWYEDVAIPALLRAARRAYGSQIAETLARAGCGDMPRNGRYVIGAITRAGSPLGEIIGELGMSKQAAGQLVDMLVTRGYLARSPDDRRRMTISLTERGQLAASEIRAAIERVDAQLSSRVGAECVRHAKAALGALVDLAHEAQAAST